MYIMRFGINQVYIRYIPNFSKQNFSKINVVIHKEINTIRTIYSLIKERIIDKIFLFWTDKYSNDVHSTLRSSLKSISLL